MQLVAQNVKLRTRVVAFQVPANDGDLLVASISLNPSFAHDSEKHERFVEVWSKITLARKGTAYYMVKQNVWELLCA